MSVFAIYIFNITGSRFLPKFETTAEGFTSLKMVPRTDAKEKEPSPLTTQSSKKYTWDQSQFDFTQTAKETFEIGIYILNNSKYDFFFLSVMRSEPPQIFLKKIISYIIQIII